MQQVKRCGGLTVMKVLSGFLISGVLLLSLISQPVNADMKYYQYNGDMPFIEMMLNMMVAMGMIDKVPGGMSAYNGFYSNPYMGNPYQTQPYFNNLPVRPVMPPGMLSGPPASLMNQSPANMACTSPPCINSFQRESLNGVWLSRQGEMLGIKNRQFLWSDGYSRYLNGQIKINPQAFTLKTAANVPPVSYQYQLSNNRLQTRDTNGIVRQFVRMPMNRKY
jgi:hypothetical protein